MKKGFTLIELMIVIAIIGILSAILIPSMMRARHKALLSACKQNLHNLASAIESYATADSNHYYPPDLNTLYSQGFISTAIPPCPVDKVSLYNYTRSGGDNYTIQHSVVDLHIFAGVSGKYPMAEGKSGLMDY